MHMKLINQTADILSKKHWPPMGTPSSGKSRGWTDINLNADFISILIQNDPWPASFTSRVISSKRV